MTPDWAILALLVLPVVAVVSLGFVLRAFVDGREPLATLVSGLGTILRDVVLRLCYGGTMTRRTREEYEELARLMDEAKEAVGRVQDMIGHMFSTLDLENRALPTRYDEKALEIQFALERLGAELALERRNEVGDQATHCERGQG